MDTIQSFTLSSIVKRSRELHGNPDLELTHRGRDRITAIWQTTYADSIPPKFVHKCSITMIQHCSRQWFSPNSPQVIIWTNVGIVYWRIYANKQWGPRWFETPACSLWRHCNTSSDMSNIWKGTHKIIYFANLAPVPLSIFRSNSKFDENSECSSF